MHSQANRLMEDESVIAPLRALCTLPFIAKDALEFDRVELDYSEKADQCVAALGSFRRGEIADSIERVRFAYPVVYEESASFLRKLDEVCRGS